MTPREQENLDSRLIEAVYRGDTKTVQTLLVQTLLASGADVHAQDDWALRWAAYDGQTETVQTLLASGANVHANNGYALRWAAEDDHTGGRIMTGNRGMLP
jgi:ankyrin repeat protein